MGAGTGTDTDTSYMILVECFRRKITYAGSENKRDEKIDTSLP